MDERNVPQTDAELDKILPTQGYEVSHSSISSSQSNSYLLFHGFGLIIFFYQFKAHPNLCCLFAKPSFMEVLTTYLVSSFPKWLVRYGNSGPHKYCLTLEQILPWCKLVTNASHYSVIYYKWAINQYSVDNQTSRRLFGSESSTINPTNWYFCIRDRCSIKLRIFHTWCHQNQYRRFQLGSRSSSRQGCSALYQAWRCKSF